MNDDKRNLTDADVEAIVASLKDGFFSNVGQGVWAFAVKGIILGLIALAFYGMGKH